MRRNAKPKTRGNENLPKMEIVPLTQFRPQEDNINVHTPYGTKLLDDSIHRDGFISAITVAADDQSFDGSNRLERGVDAGFTEAIVIESDGTRPVIVRRTDIKRADSKEAKRLGFLANHITTVDFKPDAALLAALTQQDDISRIIANENEMLRKLLRGNGHQEETVDPGELIDRASELQEKWGTETGQLWELGKHRLVIGDSTNKDAVDTLMQGKLGALLLTDPPYAIKTLGGFGSESNRSYDGLKEAPPLDTWMGIYNTYLRETGAAFVWEDWRSIPKLWEALEKNIGQVRDFVVWHVTNRRARQYRKGFYPEFDVCLYAAKKSDFEWHFTDEGSRANVYTSAAVTDDSGVYGKKPVELLKRFIEYTTSMSDIVIDAFLGSGSTLVSAEGTGRICYGMEKSEKFAAVVLERWSLLTGLAPRRARAG